MKCKFCGAELDENLTVCPVCQNDLSEEATEAAEATELLEESEVLEEAAEETEESVAAAEETVAAAEEAVAAAEEAVEAAQETANAVEAAPAKEKKGFPILAVVLCGLAACAIAALIIFGPKLISLIKNGGSPVTETIGQTDLNSDGGALTDVAKYAVDDVASADDARMQLIVAACGESKLTNAELQILFRIQYQYYMQYAPYYAMYGMETPDEAIPLSDQVRTEDGLTWEQYFLQGALDYANELLAAQEEGRKNGYTLDAEMQETIDGLADSLEEEATTGGYASAQEYIQEAYGAGVSVESFAKFYAMYAYANSYQQEVYNNLTCTEEEVNAFFDENPDVMSANGVSKQSADVRHILITPEDADGDGTSTDEEWAAAEAEAQRVYELYQADPTVDNFTALAAENSDDPGSAENGGLYEGVIPGEMVTEFNDWIFDGEHEEGDTDIVKTSHGYHIMYFVSVGENDEWYASCEELLKSDKMTQVVSDMADANPLKVWYNAIVLDDVQKEAETEDTTVATEAETQSETSANE